MLFVEKENPFIAIAIALFNAMHCCTIIPEIIICYDLKQATES